MTSSQCLPTNDQSCLPTTPPLSPLINQTLVTPLFLLSLTLLTASLLISHYVKPISGIGQLGPRGRRNYAWNESLYGTGGGFWDWWLFGGCVWIRAGCFIVDLVGGGSYHDEHEVGGENLFACFGVHKEGDGTEKLGEEEKDSSNKQGEECKHDVGIVGYDSSLGAHGPVVLAPIRASVLLLLWCSLYTFIIQAHGELSHWLVSVDGGGIDIVPTLVTERLVTMGLYFLNGALGPFNAGAAFFHGGIISSTIIYAVVYTIIFEVVLLILGMLLNKTGIYTPKGVSHPGGPRPHRIMRIPKWTSKQHFMPKELLANTDGKWRCAVAHDAHRDTVAKFNTGSAPDATKGSLTGEPFGRQLWTMLEPQPRVGDTETEDDLNATLKKEMSKSSDGPTKGDSKQQKETKEEMPNLFHQISGFFNQSPQRNSATSQSKDKSRVANHGDLAQSLASGGRPPLTFDPSKNVNSCDQIFRAQMISSYLEENGGKLPDEISHIQSNPSTPQDKPKTVKEAASRGIAFYSLLQTPDGHWAGDYGGPHFLMPGLIVAWYIMKRPECMISPSQASLMLHYLKVHQQEDGGWGTHIESPSTMFGTVMSYLAVRLLGAQKDEDWVSSGREFILKEGGAVMTSSWAKFWLCLIGCMDWKGHNSVPPEMWLLPNWFPFHPGRLWCHCRMVYLPMGYLYGSRFTYSEAESDPLIKELREELYVEPYNSINWDSTRHLVAPMDNYSPIPLFMKFAQNCLSLYENWSIFRPLRDAVRKAGLKFCLEYMRAEDLQTNYIDIGPVNKALNLVSAYHASNFDINDPAVQSHMMRVPDYLWLAEDGMKMQGYNGSQCWDTSFAIQAVWECGLLDKFPLMSAKVWAYLERTQILSTKTSQSSPAYQYESCHNRDKFYRHVSQGGWPFSTSAHGWPISDCTGEGLKGVLTLMDSPLIMKAVKSGVLKSIDSDRLYDAVNVILTLQNEDGGWATYENNRGFGWYEQLNPSEVFGDIMIDYSYVECSMASLTALAEFHEKFPSHRSKEVAFAIFRGGEFMKSIQREDGSWYGSWACCFTYGCWFGIEGLIKAGEQPSSECIQKCCQFLLSQQRPNGGWGEDFTSCYDKAYAANGMQSYGDDGSGVVNTAWALMALSAAKCDDVKAIQRGVQYLMRRQLDCGDWPQEGISGVFNRACGITYTAYRNVFPIWALGRCAATYGEGLDEA